MTLLLLLATAAQAGTTSFGVGLGFMADLPDAAKGNTNFGGPTLSLPLRIGVSSAARIRIEPRADIGMGSNFVSWAGPGMWEGEPYRLSSEEHWAMLTSAQLLVGVEADAPINSEVKPYFGGAIGLAWVGTWHSFGDESNTGILLSDYSEEERSNSSTIEPNTQDLVPITDLEAGVRMPLGDSGMKLDLGLGYSFAFLGEKRLSRTPDELDATRGAYGWNAIRVGAGIEFEL